MSYDFPEHVGPGAIKDQTFGPIARGPRSRNSIIMKAISAIAYNQYAVVTLMDRRVVIVPLEKVQIYIDNSMLTDCIAAFALIGSMSGSVLRLPKPSNEPAEMFYGSPIPYKQPDEVFITVDVEISRDVEVKRL